jgi:site-specific DNA-methyltransferase (adenine-specific)
MGKKWDSSGIAFDEKVWKEVLRVLKPGGYLLSFGGTRTYHRVTCAIEDSGFEVRDCLMWIYSSGFPKSLDVSKAIDKESGEEREVIGKVKGRHTKTGTVALGSSCQEDPNLTKPSSDLAKEYDGWGTALKPAYEPIILARKPIEGTVAKNVMKYGTGGINIDGCRIGTEERSYSLKGGENLNKLSRPNGNDKEDSKGCGAFGIGAKQISIGNKEVSGRFLSNIVLDEESAILLDKKESDVSRFFYCSKASQEERMEENNHPTVKPIDLIRYLVRLITPKNGLVVDPFNGSGTTGIACIEEKFRYVGIDLGEENIKISSSRMEEYLARKGIQANPNRKKKGFFY